MTAPRIDLPYATTLIAWVSLLIIAGVALVALAALARRQDNATGPGRGTGPGTARGAPPTRRRRVNATECARLRGEATRLAREAAGTAAKADRASAHATVAEANHAHARLVREEAGRAHDTAQRSYEDTLAAWRTGEARRTERARDGDEERRDREVSRAALAAYRRGDLSVDELREVFRRTTGWDPAQEQREREIGLLRAEAHRTHRVYDAAVAAERIATKEATVAGVGAQALRDEAVEVAQEARQARVAAEECAKTLRGRWFR